MNKNKEGVYLLELHERRDFIQIDYRNGNFLTVCIQGVLNDKGDKEEVNLGILQRFKDNLEECIKFTLGAMCAVRLFREKEYRPVDYIEIVYTKEAKEQILKKKYRVAEMIYPDLKLIKKGWLL